MSTELNSLSHSRKSGHVDRPKSTSLSLGNLESPLSPDFEESSYNPSAGLLERYEEPKRRPTEDVGTIVIVLLTISNFGVQGIWSTLMSHGTLYLHTLGLSPTLTAVVWLAGPLSGALIQPLIGAHSDRCCSKWGRRKPYIVTGTICTMICLLALSTVQEFVTMLYTIYPGDTKGNHETLIKTLAVFWVYALNLAIQPLQAGVRAFVVDNCPAHQQVQASGWVSRFNSLGSVVFFFLGSHSLPSWLGNTQFRAMSIIASAVLAIVVPSSFMLAKDKVLSGDRKGWEKRKSETKSIFRTLVMSARSMPPRSRTVCKIQIFAWLGWFPFLYYNTSYISSLYPTTSSTPTQTARTATHASLLFALTSLTSTLFLPKFLTTFPSLSLPLIWRCSHLVFAVCMLSTYFITTVPSATIVVMMVGIPWACAMWAPFAIISEELALSTTDEDEDDGDVGIGDVQGKKIASGKGSVGATMGLHNIAIAAPQIVAAVACSVLFKVFEIFGVENGFGWVLRIAGLASVGCLWCGRGLR